MHVEGGRHLYGGAEQVRSLLAALGRSGVDNLLVCRPGSAIAAAAHGAEVIELRMDGDLDFRFAGRLARVLRRLEPDLVHVHSRRGADWFAGWAAARGKWPAVLTRRVDAREPSLLARFKYRPYRAVIAISISIRRQLEKLGVEPSRLYCVPSAVDTARFRPQACRARLIQTFGLPENGVIIGMVAQLIPRKGHEVLLSAAADLAQRHRDLTVLCFGQGRLEQRLRRRVAELGLGAHVRLAGFRTDLPDLLPGLDLLAHPARREGMGVALLEALSAGLPVVASAVGGIVDVVDDGVHGLLVPPGDPAALAAALERLIADPDQRRRMGNAGRARVEARFSIGRMAAGNLAVYRAVLAGAP